METTRELKSWGASATRTLCQENNWRWRERLSSQDTVSPNMKTYTLSQTHTATHSHSYPRATHTTHTNIHTHIHSHKHIYL